MRLLLIVNASASSVTARARVVISKALAADHEVSVAETSRRGHATRLAMGAAADGADVVVVLGGDGTVNEAANGLIGSRTALGVLPGGSTNVFARTVGFANDPIEATGELLASLADDRIRPVGVGQVNDRYFLFHVGFGFDAAVVAEVEKRSAAKRFLGPAVFVTAALSAWAGGYRRDAPRFDLRGPGVELTGGTFAVVLSTSPYTYLGSQALQLVPGTGFDTGLSVVWFPTVTLTGVLGAVAAGIRARRAEPLAGRRSVAVARDVFEAELAADRPVEYQVDGDHLGSATHFRLRRVPDALRLVLPRPAHIPWDERPGAGKGRPGP